MFNKDHKLIIIYSLFVILTISTIFPVIFYLRGYEKIFEIYGLIYFACIFVYIWYRFINLAYLDLRENPFGVNLFSSFTVIIPTYNEDPKLLNKCVESVQKAKGNKKIIIIDDGSQNEILDLLKNLKKKYDNLEVYRFIENKGKRKVLFEAFKRIKTEFIVTIDSDTIIDKNAFIYLLAPFVNKETGATTGNIELLNEKRNILTRIIAAMYLSGLNNYKKSQSALGNVICCSGCLSAYRTEIIQEISSAFINQKFMGKYATHSEDRHLTNLILERGKRVYYVEEAMCYTETPYTLRSFLKQQQRWKRGFVRETIYLLSHSYKVRKSLFFEALIGNALPFFLSFGIQLLILSIIILNPTKLILYIIPSWILFMTIKELPMFLEHPKRSFWFYFYIFLYEIIIFWLNIWAIFTVNNMGWLTRQQKSNPF